MNKALFVAAAAALAISGSVFAKGNGVKTGASANAYIDENAQITANDCQQLSVASARNACMRSARNGSGMHENTGGTSGSGGMGQGSGGHSMHGGSMSSADSGARSPMRQGR